MGIRAMCGPDLGSDSHDRIDHDQNARPGANEILAAIAWSRPGQGNRWRDSRGKMVWERKTSCLTPSPRAALSVQGQVRGRMNLADLRDGSRPIG